MAKKLLGERQIGDAVFTAGQILSDEEFAASGLAAADVVNVSEEAAAAAAPQDTAAAPKDADADLDAQAAAKQPEQESAHTGSEVSTSENSGAGGTASVEAPKVEGEPLTIEHVLTGQDLLDNPALGEQGLKEGDTVRLPAVEKVLTQEDLDATPSLVAQGKVVGDTVLVAKEA